MEIKNEIDSSEDAIQFIGGFLKDFIGNDYISEITGCAENIEDEIGDIRTAVDDFKSGNTVDAVSEFMFIILDWPTILAECITSSILMVEDMAKLEDWATLYKSGDPRKVTKLIATRLMFNLADIIEQIEEIDEALTDGTMYYAG